ncbi:sulfatase-like hydrolase/transferase [Paracoccus sp. SM22M-07]|uniref:sulfatase-like hydrolase/transferase n=1 Tax=Paracoccus sp. SM22M-07 TaxID=1520813 RepID=UPI000912A404|nr:sulfatase-like hydrolase/transferase [Paracoccus sp. SM22M-07]OJH43054.1 sulfatase [Paracoccus sp. SM22M-07]
MIVSIRTVLGALTLTASAALPVAAQDTRPNILIVLFDDVGFTGLGAYGADAKTPHVDALAQSGALFSRYYTSPFCGPSRAMLMTGLDNHQTGIGTLVESVTPEQLELPAYSMLWDENQTTVASLLSEAGYQTYVTGKWGIGAKGKNLPDRFGFERSYVMDSTGGSNYDHTHYLPGYPEVPWYEDGKPVRLPEGFYSSRNLVDQMIRYIDEGDADQPFFGFLALQAVHIPVQAPAEFIDKYDGVFDKGWDVMREERWQRAIKLGLVPPTTTLAPVHEDHRAWDDLSVQEKAEAARAMQVNAGMKEAADFHIGRLLDHLEDSGKLENTIVVVTSDNGAESGVVGLENPVVNTLLSGIHRIEGLDTSYENMGLPGSLTAIGPEWASVEASPFNLYKFYSSEGGLRVPLVMAGPGVNVTGVQDAPVHVTDLMPTLLDAAGVAYDADALYGQSILPFLSGASTKTRGPDKSFGFEVSGNAALYRGNWKLVRTALPRGDFTWRLFDLSVDPGETTDLSSQNPELFTEMRAEYEAYADETGVLELGPEDYAEAQVFSNLLEKVIPKYWPYLAGLVLALLGGLYGLLRLVRMFVRRPAN